MRFPDYLEQAGMTVYAFFTEHGLPKTSVYRAAHRESVEYATAKRISEATGNQVTVTEIME